MKLCHIYFCVLPVMGLCQPNVNLLPNPDFETFISCPDSNQFNNYVEGWNAVGTSGINFARYYHRCDANTQINPNQNIMGEGSLRVGGPFNPTDSTIYASFIYAELKEPLVQDAYYYFEYTSAPDAWVFPIIDCPLDKIDDWCIWPFHGFTLTSQPPDNLDEIAPFKEVKSFGRAGYENIDLNALRLGQCYKASGNEKYFVFGTFMDRYQGEDFCLRGSVDGNHCQFGSTLDNFRFEKLEYILTDTTLCPKEFYSIQSNVRQYALPNFPIEETIWSDGVTGFARNFEQSGEYYANIPTACGFVQTNSVYIEVVECLDDIYVPNAFSPNQDGINDSIKPLFAAIPSLESVEFLIYDRWGNQVFRTSGNEDSIKAWDGTIDGTISAPGVYTWMLIIITNRSNEENSEVYYGDFALIR